MPDKRDIELAKRAGHHHGVFRRADARDLGFSRKMMQHRLEAGIWTVLHPTVYSYPSIPASWEREQTAACFWCGGISAGRAAGHLFGLPGCDDPPLEVLTTSRKPTMPRCGITVHETKWLPERQIHELNGIPTTSIERTLMMLCVQLSKRNAAIAVDNALYRGLTTLGDLDFCLYLTCRQGRGGSTLLRHLIQSRASIDKIPSTPLETVILDALLEGELPAPCVQFEVRDHQGLFVARPDFVYPEAKLVIEGHSKLWHTGYEASETDAKRHFDLESLGHRVLYATWADATRYRKQLVKRVRMLLENPDLRGSARPPGVLS